MKLPLLALVLAVSASCAHARLGETREQSEARYGLPKSEHTPTGVEPLMMGARELTFHHEGFRIRCTLLLATDGVEYIVREEYSRLVKQSEITSIEREAILTAEGPSWASLKRGDPRMTALPPQSNFMQTAGEYIWLRKDGALLAQADGGWRVRLELPQAAKHEGQMKVAQEQIARATAPTF